MRWQARLDSEGADRFLPWVGAGLLSLIFFVLAEAKVRSGGASPSLAAAAQGAWLIAHFKTPHLTLTDTHLLAQHLPLGFYPLGWATRLLPTVPTLLALQAIALGSGVIPLWRIARDIAALRAGAALALCAAYGLSPTLNNLDLAGFNPAAIAVAPLLGATYLADPSGSVTKALTTGFAAAGGSSTAILTEDSGRLLVRIAAAGI